MKSDCTVVTLLSCYKDMETKRWPDAFLTSGGKGRELGQGKYIYSATAESEALQPNSMDNSTWPHRWVDVVEMPYLERTLVVLKMDPLFFQDNYFKLGIPNLFFKSLFLGSIRGNWKVHTDFWDEISILWATLHPPHILYSEGACYLTLFPTSKMVVGISNS